MMIRKCTASFGKLNNETLTFRDGLNVIYAPNESGKSTWCAFIQAMLYGIDSAERIRAGYLPDKLRYAPWSGAPMEGSMDLVADRCDITISRRTRGKNAPMQDFSAVYTGTNVPVKGLNGQNAGELLTGVSKDVFRRSAFIAQGSVGITGSAELEKRISSIVTTGEEECSYSEADEQLRAWQRKRRYNRKGLLPALEGRMDEAQRRLEEMSGSIENVEELENRLEQRQLDCARLEKQVAEARRTQRRDALDRLSRSRRALEESSTRHDEAMETLSQLREELRRDRFGLREPESLEADTAADLERLSSLRVESGKTVGVLFVVLFVALAMVAAALYANFQNIVYILVAGVLCTVAIVFLFRFSREHRRREEARSQRTQLLEKYHAQSAAEIRQALEEHRALWERMEEAEQAERACRGSFESARGMLSEMEETALKALDFTDSSSEAARLSRQLAAGRAEIEALSRQLATASGRLAAMGDPLVLSSSLNYMQGEYEELCDEFEAIGLALDTLRDADEEIQRRFSPELGRVASGYMSAVTGGRYADVLINRDFSAMTRVSDDAVSRSAEYLSAGTLDIMYLAVRLAVCKLALPEGEPCPLILDDALVNLDEERLEQAMKLLGEIAKERQVILFSCRRQDNALPAPSEESTADALPEAEETPETVESPAPVESSEGTPQLPTVPEIPEVVEAPDAPEELDCAEPADEAETDGEAPETDA